MKKLLILCLFVLAAFAFGCDGDGDGDPCEGYPSNCLVVGGECRCPEDADDADDAEDAPGDQPGDDRPETVEDVPADTPVDTVTEGDSVTPDTEDDVNEDDLEEEEPCEQTCEENEDCDDSNVCTEDYCAPVTGCCVYFTEGLDYSRPEGCDDGVFCNGDNYCLDGACVFEEACSSLPECGVCTTEYCNEDLGICECVERDEGADCDDGEYCTGEDNVCDDEGNCIYEYPCPMFHENLCKQYACVEESDSCEEENKADGEQCSDDDPCNGTEFCEDGECSMSVRACVDGDPCTEDVCDPDTGGCIIPAPIIDDCSYCEDPSVCDDDDMCTDDYCWIIGGGSEECEHLYVPMCI